MTKKLPIHPNISHLRKQAKDLLAGVVARKDIDIQRIKEFHPRGASFDTQSICLSDAQLVLAREYGFESWPRMKSEMDTLETGENTGRRSNLNRALEDLRSGRLCILFDDEGRENEGDFVLAGEKVSPEM